MEAIGHVLYVASWPVGFPPRQARVENDTLVSSISGCSSMSLDRQRKQRICDCSTAGLRRAARLGRDRFAGRAAPFRFVKVGGDQRQKGEQAERVEGKGLRVGCLDQ